MICECFVMSVCLHAVSFAALCVYICIMHLTYTHVICKLVCIFRICLDRSKAPAVICCKFQVTSCMLFCNFEPSCVDGRVTGVASVQLTGSQADLVAAASSGNLQALNSMSTGNLAGLSGNASMSQSQVSTLLLDSAHDTILHAVHDQDMAAFIPFHVSPCTMPCKAAS